MQKIPEPSSDQGFLINGRCPGLKFCELLARYEIGTGFGNMGQLAVAEDLGIGIIDLQRLQQMPHGGFLLLGAGVGSFSVGQQSTLVANADGVLVIVPGMGSWQVLVPRLVQLTVTGDIVVVAGEPEAGLMTGYQLGDGERAVAARRRAVDNNQINLSHNNLCVF